VTSRTKISRCPWHLLHGRAEPLRASGVGVRADSYSVPACRNKISPAASASAIPDVAGLVVHDRKDPVARLLERAERRHLRLRDALLPCARVHVQQLLGELDPVLPAQRVERLQRLHPEQPKS
jgi:hypothetical protein